MLKVHVGLSRLSLQPRPSVTAIGTRRSSCLGSCCVTVSASRWPYVLRQVHLSYEIGAFYLAG